METATETGKTCAECGEWFEDAYFYEGSLLCNVCDELAFINYRREQDGLKPLPTYQYLTVDTALDPETYDYEQATDQDWQRISKECPPDWFFQHMVNATEAGLACWEHEQCRCRRCA